jgi:hypothetical protein
MMLCNDRIPSSFVLSLKPGFVHLAVVVSRAIPKIERCHLAALRSIAATTVARLTDHTGEGMSIAAVQLDRAAIRE